MFVQKMNRLFRIITHMFQTMFQRMIKALLEMFCKRCKGLSFRYHCESSAAIAVALRFEQIAKIKSYLSLSDRFIFILLIKTLAKF